MLAAWTKGLSQSKRSKQSAGSWLANASAHPQRPNGTYHYHGQEDEACGGSFSRAILGV